MTWCAAAVQEGEQRENPTVFAAENVLQPPARTVEFGKVCNAFLPCLRAGRCQGRTAEPISKVQDI